MLAPRALCLFALLATPLVAAAQSSGSTLSARSSYPPGGITLVQADPTPNPFAEESAPAELTRANYLSYEPQNEPLSGDLPPSLDAVFDPQTTPTSPPAESPLNTPEPPWIVPIAPQFSTTWTSGSGDQVGMLDLDGRVTLVMPKRPGFMATIGYAAHLFNGPVTTDLPAAVYDHWIEFRWLKKFNERWAMDLAVTPSLYTDYENTSSGAFRMQGRALALYTASPELQWAFGAIYLGREDVKALPAVGAIWTPNDDYKIEVLFPRPRVMRKLSSDDDSTRWLYIGGEFGGGSWGIERSGIVPGTSFHDVVTYSALRMLIGYEHKRAKGFSPWIEAGWTFNRSLAYKTGLGDTDLSSAATLRFGGSF